MKFRMSLLAVVVALILFAPLSRAETCNTVIDKAGIVRNPAIITNAARTLVNQAQTSTWSSLTRSASTVPTSPP